MIAPSENIQAPRIRDPDTARLCTILAIKRNASGIRLLTVQEDPEHGKATRWGQCNAYMVAA